MNLQSWILLLVVVVCFAAAVRHIVKNKGGCSCAGNCSRCGKTCAEKKK